MLRKKKSLPTYPPADSVGRQCQTNNILRVASHCLWQGELINTNSCTFYTGEITPILWHITVLPLSLNCCKHCFSILLMTSTDRYFVDKTLSKPLKKQVNFIYFVKIHAYLFLCIKYYKGFLFYLMDYGSLLVVFKEKDTWQTGQWESCFNKI